MYGIACWYQTSQHDKALRLGTSFIPAYAESLGLNAPETMDALLNDLHVRHLRLVSYWDQLEPTEGKYDFSLLDWQFKKAEAVGATISLSLGLRQPRWPECHMPAWASQLPDEQWQPRLNKFIGAVVNRYKHSPSLDSYQLENEFLLRGFGSCQNFDRQRLVNEYRTVKRLDPTHKLIVARSNNVLGTPLGQPVPDEYAVSVYKRVWDSALTRRYLEYPIPPWYYAFLAGLQKLTKHKDMLIHELQAEAWPPKGQLIPNTSLAEQNKSIDAARLQQRFQYGKDTGMRDIYLWGSEYWYYRMIKLHDPSLWHVAKEEFARHD